MPPTNHSLALIVTADDFGIGYATSAGIIKAHLQGPVTATSVMTITGDHLRRSIPLLEKAPNLDLGLHAVLTQCGEKPLMARQSSGLVDREGNFLTNGKLWIRALTRKLNQRAVAEEITAQAELFHKLIGRAPDYVDSHHHTHHLPIIREALLEVIAANLLPNVSRVTVEPPGMLLSVGSARINRLAAHRMGLAAYERFRRGWLWTNDYYFGMLSRSDLRRPFPWARYLKNLPSSGVVEWIVHPGEVDDSLARRDSYRVERAIELDALTRSLAEWESLRPMLSRKSVLSKTEVMV